MVDSAGVKTTLNSLSGRGRALKSVDLQDPKNMSTAGAAASCHLVIVVCVAHVKDDNTTLGTHYTRETMDEWTEFPFTPSNIQQVVGPPLLKTNKIRGTRNSVFIKWKLEMSPATLCPL
jgi:hypothetical protein